MPDWIVCPGCNLRHTARPDGLCPRCRKPVAPAAARAPAPAAAPRPAPAEPAAAPPPLTAPPAPAAAAPEPAAAAPVAQGAVQLAAALVERLGRDPLRIAGAALLVLGASTVALLARRGGAEPDAIVLAIVDLLLGGALVAGLRHRPLLVAAAVRAGAAAVLGAAALLLHRGAVSPALQLLLAAGLAGVLAGRTRPQALAGAAAALVAVVANGVVVARTMARPLEDPLTPLHGPGLAALSYDGLAERPATRELEGPPGPSWRAELPGGHWRMKPGGPTRVLSPRGGASDLSRTVRAIVWASRAAEIAFIVQSTADLHGAGPSLSASTGDLVQQLGRSAPGLERISEPEPFGSRYESNLVRARTVIDGRKHAILLATFVFDDGAIHVLGKCPVEYAGDLEDDFLRIARSLRRVEPGSGT